MPFLRRGEDGRHLANARHRHLQRSRNRRCRHRQHVDVRAQRLDVFLVFDAETLLLVDDHQPEVFPRDAGLQQSVRTDHDVDLALRHLLDDLA